MEIFTAADNPVKLSYVSGELSSMEIIFDVQRALCFLSVSGELSSMEIYYKIEALNSTGGVLFQENLVVWKSCMRSNRQSHAIQVSGELSSMEIFIYFHSLTSAISVSGELSSMEIYYYVVAYNNTGESFQENLVVWKSFVPAPAKATESTVSGELSSMEILKLKRT